MKTGAADWFHQDLCEDEQQSGNQPDRWPTGLEEQHASQLPAFAAEVATKAEQAAAGSVIYTIP